MAGRGELARCPRYELAAVLGPRRVLATMVSVYPGTAPYPLDAAGLALLPVTPVFAREVTPAALCGLGLSTMPGGTPLAARVRSELLTGPESGFQVLTPGVVALIEAASTLGPLAYVEADYAAGIGSQAAAVWRVGRLSSGPLLLGRREELPSADLAPIPTALRALGVTSRVPGGEVAVAGLCRHHRTGDWAPGAQPAS